ncbi:hypothetical protein [Arthrobacter sp. ISL-69]|uniref:hypothetical protein n=1 Tax=Arthrobacter sp. ISL-69 TaxID=2819113 RepID=UPI001BE9F17A|nr:hypothetical protein [Arthrobacter sp. ISL-69]MBT2538568.1 hypothetical protein [Arthrobacter sp. ISL-69]
MTRQMASANVLKHELAVMVREKSKATANTVFNTLANLSGHPGWGGAEAATLLSVDAPAGPAMAGTEFTSTSEDATCRIWDSSVVTEAVRPATFEKVTESRLKTKRKGTPAQWLLVHRYEIEPVGVGSRITYTCRLVRADALPGSLALLGIPVLRWLASREWARASRAGLRRLVAAAETKPWA